MIGHAPENWEVFFRRSTDGGASFDNAINLSNGPSFSWGGKIAISKNYVYVVYYDNKINNNYQVFLRVSSDNGASFNLPVNVSNNNSKDARFPDIAVNGDTVYIVWESVSGSNEVFFNKSVNGGASFGTAINLTSFIIAGSFPPGVSVSKRPQVAAAGNNVYVVWLQGDYIDDTVGDIAFIRSTNRANSFDTPINLSKTPGGISEFPHIGVINNKDAISITWEDWTGSNSEIFMKNSMDCGATFSGVINLSNSTGLYYTTRLLVIRIILSGKIILLEILRYSL